jgi:zinc transport system substrate-binding protein
VKRFCALLLVLILFPCAALSETVVTSFYPIWIMTLNLTRGLEDHITVRNLAAPTVGCLHDYQLQSSDMKVLSGADAFLVNGAGMEAFLP